MKKPDLDRVKAHSLNIVHLADETLRSGAHTIDSSLRERLEGIRTSANLIYLNVARPDYDLSWSEPSPKLGVQSSD